MLSAEDRYYNDPEFRALVELLYRFVVGGKYTPSELREAIILAATKYEMSHVNSPFVNQTRTFRGVHMNAEGRMHAGPIEDCYTCKDDPKTIKEMGWDR